MNTHANKEQDNKNHQVIEETAKRRDDGDTALQFVDKRPEGVAQRKFQKMANASEQAQQTAQLQELANQHASSQRSIQKKENNTGLPDTLKSGIENLSGYAMDDVQVHRNSDKPAKLNAHAYAQGTDIHLGPGQEKHLPHEAWHVVQQKQGRVQPTMQMKGKVNINDDAGLEKEADVMGEKAMQQKVDVNLINSKQQEQSVVQRMYMTDEGNDLTNEQYDTIDTLINRYDDANDGDVAKGGDAELTSEQIAIGVALTELITYLVDFTGGKEKRAKMLWGGIFGAGKRFKGSMWDAVEMARTGRQCNNEMAEWMRACMRSFTHYPDDDE